MTHIFLLRRVAVFLFAILAVASCLEPSGSATVASSSYAKVKYANGQKNNTYRFAFQRDPTIQYVSAEDLRPKLPSNDNQTPVLTPDQWKSVTENKKIVVGSSKSSSVSVQTSDNHRYYPAPTTTTEEYDMGPVQDHADNTDMWMQSSNEEGEVLGNGYDKSPTGHDNWGSSVSMSTSVSSSGMPTTKTQLHSQEPHQLSVTNEDPATLLGNPETRGYSTSSTEEPYMGETGEYAHASDDNLGQSVTTSSTPTTTTMATTRTITTPTTTRPSTTSTIASTRRKATTEEPPTDSQWSGDRVEAKTDLPPQMTQRPPRPVSNRKDDASGMSVFAQELIQDTGAQSAWRPFVGPPVKQLVSKKRPVQTRPVTLLIKDVSTDPPLFFKDFRDPEPGSAVVGDNIQFGEHPGSGSGMALFVPAPKPNPDRNEGVFGTVVDTNKPQFIQNPEGPRPTPGPLDIPAPSRDRMPQRPLQATPPRPPGLVVPTKNNGDLDIEAILKDLKTKIPNGPVQINPQMMMGPNRPPGPFPQRPPFQQGSSQQGPPQQGSSQQGPSQQGPFQQGPPQQGPFQQGPPQQRPFQQGPPQQGPQQGPPQQGPQQGPPQQFQIRPPPGFVPQGPINGRPMNQPPNGQRPIPNFIPQQVDRNDVPGSFANSPNNHHRFPDSNMVIPPNQQQFGPPNFRPPMMRPQFPPPQQQQQSSGNSFFKNLWNRLFGRSLENPEDVPIVDVDTLHSNGTLPTEIYKQLANSTYAEKMDAIRDLGFGNYTVANSTDSN